jgi:hypothetical protein
VLEIVEVIPTRTLGDSGYRRPIASARLGIDRHSKARPDMLKPLFL